MLNCNLETGVCEMPSLGSTSAPAAVQQTHTGAVRYIGDPMCSWCWGLSPTLKVIDGYCQAAGLGFSVTMGGLRAGGGDPWNSAFKAFLRKEWSHIARVTGQPFGFTVLDAQFFDYDTEPACRAVAVAQLLLANQKEGAASVLDFFTAVQRRFYVDGADPKEPGFYQPICTDLGLDFEVFQALFQSEAGRQTAEAHFAQCRAWGVRSFPTLLMERDGQIFSVGAGFMSADDAISRIQAILALPRSQDGTAYA